MKSVRLWGHPAVVAAATTGADDGACAAFVVGPFGFRQLQSESVEKRPRLTAAWWRPLGGLHDLADWVEAYAVCADYGYLMGVINELEQTLLR